MENRPTLRSAVRERAARLGLARRTVQAYEGWIRRFIRFHRRHPREMGAPEVEAFLTMLAAERSVAASTQNQALAALLFLYREVLGVDHLWLDNIQRANAPRRLPVVLSRDEVDALLAEMATGALGSMRGAGDASRRHRIPGELGAPSWADRRYEADELLNLAGARRGLAEPFAHDPP